MPVKPSEEEDKYFHAENQRHLDNLRGTMTDSEGLALAQVVGSSDPELGRQLRALGFNAETASTLFFVPLVEVAWADGKIGYEESYKIVDALRARGIRATSEAYEFLNGLTLRRPSHGFFEGCNQIIRTLLAQMGAEARDAQVSNLSDLVVKVARASRGFFGFGAEVTKDELKAVEEIISELGLENSSHAEQLRKGLSESDDSL